MKKLTLALLAASLTLHSAYADYVIVSQNAYSSGVGGQFTAQPVNKNGQSTGPSYQTFCVDVSHTFNPGQEYSTTVGQSTFNGSGNNISIGTARLYSSFRNGTLAGYSFSGGSSQLTDAGLLQDTIWALEGESEGNSLSYMNNKNPFYNDVVGWFGSFDAAKVDANGAFGVGVLHLADNNGGIAQSQLTTVPEPGQLIACGVLAFCGVGVYIARRKLNFA
jgi:hypothetical protein